MKSFKSFLAEGSSKFLETEEEIEQFINSYLETARTELFSDPYKIEVAKHGPYVGKLQVSTSGHVNLENIQTTTLPFRFGEVGSFTCRHSKLTSTEGFPYVAAHGIDITECHSLKNLNGLSNCVISSNIRLDNLSNLEYIIDPASGLPPVGFVEIWNIVGKNNLKNLHGLGTVGGAYIFISAHSPEIFKNVNKYVKFINAESVVNIALYCENINPVLSIAMTKNVNQIKIYWRRAWSSALNDSINRFSSVITIINEGLQKDLNILDIQEELIDAGYEEYANA